MVTSVKRIAERSAYTVLVLVAVCAGNTVALAEERTSEGESLILEAHKASKAAQSTEQLTQIIELCRDAAKKGLSPELVHYNNRLRSWAHN